MKFNILARVCSVKWAYATLIEQEERDRIAAKLLSLSVVGCSSSSSLSPSLVPARATVKKLPPPTKPTGMSRRPAGNKRGAKCTTPTTSTAVESSTKQQPFVLVGPSQEEMLKMRTDREKKALTSWYDRLNELYQFKAKHGHGKYGFCLLFLSLL